MPTTNPTSNSKFKFNEKCLSQIPALQQLINLGYKYLSPEKAYRERGQKLNNVLLENILSEQIKKINRIHYKGRTYRFSEENVQSAIQKIKNMRYRGLVKTNGEVYDLLTLGTSMEQSIEGDSKSFTLNYVDWTNPSQNTFHVTAEFPVERTRSTERARPDIVLFVNGIPFVVIECKSPHIGVEEGISQAIRNQQDEYIPQLFIYAQLLMSVNKNETRYATVGTELKFWSKWREIEDSEEEVEQFINKPLDEETKESLFSGEFATTRQYFDRLGEKGLGRQITEQDKAIHSLCRPKRLMELTQLFTLYDAGKKKIARYQQFFVVHSALKRIKQMNREGKREGGMIWHTQGSGKSLTMVWLARLLTVDEEIKNPRLLIVTDRKDLDKQIKKVFQQCGQSPQQAKTGRELMKMIQSKTPIITTLVHKFDKALKAGNLQDDDPNIFVLVDESHRTQFDSLSARMRQMLPEACYIGFTGTPLIREDKNNFERFGRLIEPSYSARQAIEDKAIVPLIYEGRLVDIEQNKPAMDLWFERHTSDLNEKQKADLKRKYSRANTLKQTEQVIYMQAFDINEHYCTHWKRTGFKAQLVAPSRPAALKYHQFLKEMGDVTSEVVISSPDMREGYEEVDGKSKSEVRRFWDKMMRRFGSEAQYSETIIDEFKNAEEPEILIVVERLLTGFDASVNTVLYLCKKLKKHTLLQAIARVNRIHKGKDFGYVVDYEGILGELDKALTMYDELKEFDQADLEETLISISETIEELPQKYSNVWDIFKEVKNRLDEEEYERLLGDDKLRDEFYKCLSEYEKTLDIALSSHRFLMNVDEVNLNNYKEDRKRFKKLRESVRLRYADGVDYEEYESKIRRVLDAQIQAHKVTQVNEPTNIYHTLGQKTDESIDVQSTKRKASQADRIAHQMKRTIEEKMGENPAHYEKFSKWIQETIDNFRQERINELEYLKKVSEIKKKFDHPDNDDDMPKKLRDNSNAAAFFGVIKPIFKSSRCDTEKYDDCLADIALTIDNILEKSYKVYFWDDPDARNSVINDIEDYLYDEVKAKRRIELSTEQMDEIIEQTMRVARKRMHSKDYR